MGIRNDVHKGDLIMKKRALFPVTACAVILCLLSQPPAMAAKKQMSIWEATVRGQLAIYALALSLANARLVYAPVGELEEGGYDTIRVRLYRGYRYSLVGVWDTDCTTLGMSVYPEDRSRVASQSGLGSQPVFDITPSFTQDYTVRIVMQRCKDEPCYYGLGVYRN
jgi:hypothetical protein